MIKLILQISQVIIAVIIALLFGSCGFNSKTIDGSGNVIKQDRKIAGAFTQITAEGGLDVYVIQGSTSSVVVEADDNLQAHIKTELKGSELKISTDVNIGHADARMVTVTLPKVEAIGAHGGSTLKSKTILKAESLDLTSSSGSNMEVSVDAKNVSLDASSGSSLKASGKADELKTDASSGSSLHAEALAAKEVKAEASSGSTTTVNALDSLDADASSGSSINYVSTPKKLSANESSGGSVSQD